MNDSAPNLDGMSWDDLDMFWRRVCKDANAVAAELFSDNDDGRKAVEDLGLYACTKKKAMQCRAAGEINEALSLERWCDEIYIRLPLFARW